MKEHRAIFANAGSLVGTTAVTSLLGFVYWWLAARQFTPEAVGLASALISVMMLLGNLCVLGLGTLLIGELPRQPGREAALISSATLLVGLVAACVGAVFAIVALYLSSDFYGIHGGLGEIALFAFGISLTAITLVLDQALIGLLRGGWQLWRNILFAVAKLAALFVAALVLQHVAGMTIYATWAIGNAFSLAVLAAVVIWKWGWPGKTYLPRWGLLGRLRFAALQHHILNLALQAPALALPVLVTVLLSPATNAWFYVSWMIAGFMFVLPVALTIALYAASSAQRSILAHRMHITLAVSFVTCVLANCILLFGANLILGFFGPAYAEQAGWSLRILGIAGFPLIIKDHYVALCRIRDRVAPAMIFAIIGVILELSMAALGGHFGGLAGLSLGWVIAVSIEGLFMFRSVYKAAWPEDASRDHTQVIAANHEAAYSIGTRTNEPSFRE
jgi:O-antigen/teichoic acid export membrane protein